MLSEQQLNEWKALAERMPASMLAIRDRELALLAEVRRLRTLLIQNTVTDNLPCLICGELPNNHDAPHSWESPI